MDFLKRANELKEEAVKMRRELHQIPEVGFELPQTTAYIKQKLTEYGCEFTEICKCGIICDIGNGNGKTILIRGDIDALPQPELSGEPFAATNGYSHSCGHDFHCTALLLTAKLLKECESEINGKVRLCFQPAEETIEGALAAIKGGALEGVDAAIAMHTRVGMKAGSFCTAHGNYLCSSDLIKVTVHGKGCHGSAPETGIDPINIACKVVDAIQSIQTREISCLEPNVVTFGSIHGGHTHNIVPDSVELEGTVRCFSRTSRPELKERIVKHAEAIAAAYGGSAEVTYPSQTPITYNDPKLADDVIRYLSDALGADMVSGNAPMAKGSDDFAYYCEAVPSVMYHVGVGTVEDGYVYALHNARVKFDENALPNALASFCIITTRWLEENK